MPSRFQPAPGTVARVEGLLTIVTLPAGAAVWFEDALHGFSRHNSQFFVDFPRARGCRAEALIVPGVLATHRVHCWALERAAHLATAARAADQARRDREWEEAGAHA